MGTPSLDRVTASAQCRTMRDPAALTSPLARPPTIAVFGATGNLARHLIATFLSQPPSDLGAGSQAGGERSAAFGLLVLFTRADPSETALLRRWGRDERVRVVWWREGSEIRDEGGGGEDEDVDLEGGREVEVVSEETVARILRKYEVGVVVNCLSPAAGTVREVVVGGIAIANQRQQESGWEGVKMYLPPEFGLDECVGGRRDEERDADGGEYQAEKRRALAAAGLEPGEDPERPYGRHFEVPEWQLKQSHYDFALGLLDPLNVQIVRLQIGLFLNAIGPWFGFHTARGVYSVVGDPAMRIAWTDLGDVARVIIALVQKVYHGESVPVRVRIAGCVASPEEIRGEMQEAGGREIMVRSGTEVGVFRNRALARKVEERSPIPFIRLILADGLGDYRSTDEGGWGSDNEYVNPGESLWKWKGIAELARQTKGIPNAGF